MSLLLIFIILLHLFSTKQITSPPSDFIITYPTKGEILDTLTPTFRWGNPQNESSFRLEISTTPDFSNIVYIESGIPENTRRFKLSDGILIPQITYFWRIIAVNRVGETIASNAPYSFTPRRPSEFSLTSPINNTIIDNLRPRLMWMDSYGESGYVVTVATDSSFTQIILQDSIRANDTDYRILPGLLNTSTTYYWRVVARNAVGETMASNAPASFTTLGYLPTAFSLISPENNSTNVSLTPVFSWTESTGEDTYTLEIATDSNFSLIIFSNNSIPMNTTNYQLPSGILNLGKTYYWRVIAVNTLGQTVASGAPFFFTTMNGPSGSLDLNFGSLGIITGIELPRGIANAVSVDSQWLYVAGYDVSSSSGRWVIQKRNLLTGELDLNFGYEGSVISDPSPYWDEPLEMAIDSEYIYVVGYEYVSSGDYMWRIEKRRLVDGTFDSNFGYGGVVKNNPSPSMDFAFDITIDKNWMYVVGFDGISNSGSGDYQWRIEKRSLIDGSLDINFGDGGVITNNPSVDWDTARGIVIDSNWMFVVGYDFSYWRIEKRNLIDGSLDMNFGSGGVIISDPSIYREGATDISIDSSWIYVVGADYSPGNTQWRIEKRNKVDGRYDSSFGSGGYVTSNPSIYSDEQLALAIDTQSMYVIGFDNVPGNAQWRIEKRSLINGVFDTSFGVEGVITINPSQYTDYAVDVALNEQWMFVVGLDNTYFTWRIEKRAK